MLEPALPQQLAHGVGYKLRASHDGERVVLPLVAPTLKAGEVAHVDEAMVQAVAILSDNDGEDKEGQREGRCSDR